MKQGNFFIFADEKIYRRWASSLSIALGLYCFFYDQEFGSKTLNGFGITG